MNAVKFQWAVNILNNGGTVTINRFAYRSEGVRYRLNRLYRDGVLDRGLHKKHLEFRLNKDQPKLANLVSKKNIQRKAHEIFVIEG